MKTNIKFNNTSIKILPILLYALLMHTVAYAAEVGSAFSYQGQLLDQGVPSDQKHDIRILAYFQETGGSVEKEAEFFDVQAENGLFAIPEVNFGEDVFVGQEIWLELEVRQAGGGSYDTLQPRQRVSAAPYAVQSAYATQAENAGQAQSLASIGANTDDVLKFDGTNWVPQELSGDSPWQSASTNPDDIHFITGKVGIGTVFPSGKLHVLAESGQEPLRVQSGVGGNSVKLMVHTNGGLSIGTINQAPNDGVLVQGDTKQPLDSDGMIKYMVHTVCSGAGSTVLKSYNGVNSGTVTALGSSTGNCVLKFPFDIDTRFWQVSADLPANGDDRVASCRLDSGSNSQLFCNLFKASNGSAQSGRIMILLY